MIVCETPRLRLRYITPQDAAFILALLNEPDFIRNIGDRKIRTLEDAQRYILDGTVTGYEKVGFGLYLVELKETGTPIGVCGLLKREYLEDVDVGLALSARFHRQGFGFEATTAVLQHGRDVLGIGRIVAITSPDNQESIRLLVRLGLRFERMIQVPGVDRETRLFVPVTPATSAAADSARSVNPEHVQDEVQACAEQRGS